MARTNEIGQQLDSWATRLADKGDSRPFFTYAHSYIAQEIAANITLFNNPNSLMRLLNAFATPYLNALNGTPSRDWKNVFAWCKAMDRTRQVPATVAPFFLPYAKFSWELCARDMAYVHINVDLRNALSQVKDVDPQDYGNVLKFVLGGQAYAEKKLNGRIIGGVNFGVTAMFGDLLDQSAKLWRNQVFEAIYKRAVPPPSAAFLAQCK